MPFELGLEVHPAAVQQKRCGVNGKLRGRPDSSLVTSAHCSSNGTEFGSCWEAHNYL